MARPSFNRAQTNVQDWLSSHYEYIEPDNEMLHTQSTNPYVPKPTYSDLSPEPSDKSSAPTAEYSRRRHDRYNPHNSRPLTPPSEDDLNPYDERTTGRNDKHAHHSKEARYPPRADRGRPRRPPMNTATTSPDIKQDGTSTRHRRDSMSASPTRHRDDRSSRHHSRRDEEPSSRSTRHGDRETGRPRRHRRDYEDRSHRGGTSGSSKGTHSSTRGSSTAKPRRPSLSHSQTAPSPASAGHTSKPKRSSFSFLNDPRFTAAATAAFQAGATAAVGAVGTPNAGSKVARAALGAAAMGAFQSPVTTPPPPSPVKKEPAEVIGSYFADRMERRRSKRSK